MRRAVILPSSWNWTRVDRVSSVNARIGWKALTAAEYQTDGFVFLATPNIKGREIDFLNVNYINEWRYNESPELKLQRGDVLLAKDGNTLGIVNLVKELPRPATVNGSIAVLRPYDMDPGFLRYVLASSLVQGEIGALKGGMGVPHLFQWDINRLSLPNPPLQEQRRIVDFLDAETMRIEALLSARRSQVNLIEQRGAVFEKTLISGGFARDAIDSGIPWIGKISPQASIVPLQRILVLQRGVDLTDGQRNPGVVPVITTAGVAGFHDRSIASGPGVVVGRYGSAGSVHWVEEDYWPHNTTLYVKNFNGNIPKYCYYILRSVPYDMEQARSAIPGINRNDIHKRMMPILPVSQQSGVVAEIDSYIARAGACISALETSISLLAERRQALITAAVTGQFDVTTASGRNLTQGV